MEYSTTDSNRAVIKPRLVIHGGAGNIQRRALPPEKYQEYRDSLISTVSKAQRYMNTPATSTRKTPSDCKPPRLPSALDVSTYAVSLLEDNALFNSGHGAVFTRDGINELEASVMVSRGYKKRGVGVMGLRRVRNPIQLARKMLEHGEEDLEARETGLGGCPASAPDVPSAQGHTQLWGETAEKLAEQYGLVLVDPSYFFTQKRWDEHKRALEQEASGKGVCTWSAAEYLPQGTCGAVALDEDGIICVATSTGGMTNKLTGRVGDTPVIGSGFWAEEWAEHGDGTGPATWQRIGDSITALGTSLSLTDALRGALADCFPTPYLYRPAGLRTGTWRGPESVTMVRSIGGSGTGNGDSFLRSNALRTVAAMARWKPESGARAVTHVAGPDGELQKSAGDRWKRTGEGEGGIIGIECAIVRDSAGSIVSARSEVLMDYNCGGMFRAWIDNDGKPVMSIWTNGSADKL